jgi:hypothetical protein
VVDELIDQPCDAGAQDAEQEIGRGIAEGALEFREMWSPTIRPATKPPPMVSA